MKRVYNECNKDFEDEIFGMANLMPQRTGLSVNIWSDNNGVSRNTPDKTPRVKIGYGDAEISVSISKNPEILAQSNAKQSDLKYLKEGIKYVARNYDLFLKHYNDVDGTFDDRELINELEKRGDYK